MRYLVRARVRPGGERTLLQAIEDRTLGKGSVAGGEYLRNMQDARLCPDGAARWVEVCYGPTPLQAPPTAANAETMRTTWCGWPSVRRRHIENGRKRGSRPQGPSGPELTACFWDRDLRLSVGKSPVQHPAALLRIVWRM
jgi:hypothetical protein